MQVRVVNSYEAASLSVEVIKLRKVDCFQKKNKNGQFVKGCISSSGVGVIGLQHSANYTTITLPTDGNPIRATLASPDFITSKPSPLAPADFDGSRSWALYLANLAFSKPRWYSVAANKLKTV